MSLSVIRPEWPVPSFVQAFTTTRQGGVSDEPFDTLNLALHVGDHPSKVAENRERLGRSESIPHPCWLTQVHSTRVIPHGQPLTEADGCFTHSPGHTCLVMTADCLPVLLANKAGNWVAAIHAGWRGLAKGVLLEAVQKYHGTSELMAWIGPAICQKHFEVGDDVRESFVNVDSTYEQYFKSSNNKWLCDLPAIAEHQLSGKNIDVYQSNMCTYEQEVQFFSHRRASHNQKNHSAAQTGRMVTAIWIEHTEED
ncbi:peptidoglycan editing factor PgeF [Kangiella shandongensis]|uniref:peptidoglycan editing factor PgeF n=1 Tax=Kangiella shandongensis TaxID=2763258 RepID=UPI001CBDDF1C|nr:peptidoglycan editing factor PgeF [Kangiella shandongensis]